MAAEDHRMQRHDSNSQNCARADCCPWHVSAGPSLSSADQRSERHQRSLRFELAVTFSELANLACILMEPAEYSERRKRSKEDHIAGPSVHQHVRQSEKRECDKSR